MSKCRSWVILAVPFHNLHDFLESLSTGFSACFFFRYVTFSTKDSRRPLIVKSLFPSRDPSSSSSIPSRKKTKRKKKRKNNIKETFRINNSQVFTSFSIHSLKQCCRVWNSWWHWVKQSCPLALIGKRHSLLSLPSFSFSPVLVISELSAASTKYKTKQRGKRLP